MKIIHLVFCVFLFALVISSNAFSQNTIEDQKALMYLTTPNENHELLKRMVGKWKQNYQYTRKDQQEYGKGFSENQLFFGDRFLEMFNSIDYFGTGASTMQIIGFDNYIQKYTIYSIDEIGTDSKFATGIYDAENDQLIFESHEDVLAQGKMPFRIVITFERENKFTYELFLKHEGKYKRAMLIHNIKSE
jgi:hypothetical protein